ncbi:YraN family protein [Magnetococcus sp. PR-3]|uniref:YraN family protein n=1 Tax=Magnetococcus sp. PR-3 TaxID=3120355 RepID=UPI002FCDED8E
MDFLTPKTFGKQAEDYACKILKKNGYKILKQNARTRYGELDIIALDGDVLVFCEVKARQGDVSGSPAEAIDAQKQRQLAQLAEAWQQRHPQWLNAPCRFDAVLVKKQNKRWQAEIIADAFQLGW